MFSMWMLLGSGAGGGKESTEAFTFYMNDLLSEKMLLGLVCEGIGSFHHIIQYICFENTLKH